MKHLLPIVVILLALPVPAPAQQPELVVQAGHTNVVWSASFSPDGKQVLTASRDTTAKLWDVQSGRLLHSLAGHAGLIFSAIFSPDGKQVVTASIDMTAKLWDTQSGRLLHTLAGHTDEVDSASFSPDGKQVVTVSKDNTAKLWDAQNGNLLHTLASLTHPDGSASFSPNGKIIVTTSWDSTAKLWDTQSGRLLHTLAGHTDEVDSASFSPDGKQVVTASKDNTAKLWDTQSGKLLHTLSGHTDWVHSASFSPDGKQIVTASGDKTAKLWDTQSGRLLSTLAGHTEAVWSASFSPDGKQVVAASGDQTAELWDVQSGRLLHSLAGHTSTVNSASFSPDGKQVVTASSDRTAKLWDTQSGRLLSTLAGHTEAVWSASFSPDGKQVVAASQDNTAKLWDVQSGKLLHTLKGHAGSIFSAIFSPDGKQVVTASSDMTAKLWDTQSGRLLHTLAGHTDEVDSASFSPDGKQVVTASKDNTAKLWDVQSGKLLHTLAGHTDEVDSASFSPDGKRVVTASGDKTAKLWDVRNGKPLYTLEGYTVYSASFSPDGRYMVTASGDETAMLWDVQSGKLLHALAGHTGSVYSASFSPDGKRVVTASGDETAMLWDVQSGKLLHALAGHTGSVYSASFSPDGKRVVTASEDYTAKLWDAESGKLLHTLAGHTHRVTSARFSPDGKLVVTTGDSSVRFWDAATGAPLAALYPIGEDDWAVIDPEGRFDATPGAMQEMHYVVGLEPVELSQLKDQYDTPGLLGRILRRETLPAAPDIRTRTIQLYPDIHVQDPGVGSSLAQVKLTPREGGVGRVEVRVNGHPVASGRGEPVSLEPGQTTFSVDLSRLPLVAGQQNTVQVVAWTKDNVLPSRGVEIACSRWVPKAAPRPHLWAIVAGVNDYGQAGISRITPLKNAAADARDMAQALQIAGEKYLGPGHVTVFRLYPPSPGEKVDGPPSRAGIDAAFQNLRQQKTMQPNDILVVFFAGHGATVKADNGIGDSYCYLTQDAENFDDIRKSPDVRNVWAVTAEDLYGWLKAIPPERQPQHQVIILDTCAAAAAIDQFKRGEEEDTERSLDRLNTQTGLWVMAGCAANAESFDLPGYPHGLLTYALLDGMAGKALEKGGLVDVASWFRRATDEVQELSDAALAPQQPIARTPEGAASFDIGEVPPELIPQIAAFLGAVRSLVVVQSVADPDGLDPLGLGEQVRALLEEGSARGAEVIMAGGRPATSRDWVAGIVYHVEADGAVSADITLIRGADKRKALVTGKQGETAAQLASELVEKIRGMAE